MSSDRVLADFEGDWRLDRVIAGMSAGINSGTSAGISAGRDGPEQGRFTGRAVFAPDPRGLLYRETGQLTVPGHGPVTAERSYLWTAPLDVWFDDGRFFHAVPAAGGSTEHWCDPDAYHVTYDFSAWPHFETVWIVRGPRKAYRMTTRFARP